MRIAVIAAVTGLLLLSGNVVSAQSATVWKREPTADPGPPAFFRSPQAINLPTATLIGRETFEFEVAHRFFPVIKDGQEVLFGLDGPATIRFGLTYGISDRIAVSLGRSNLDDNLDLSAKALLLETVQLPLPLAIGLHSGLGWNTRVFGLSSSDSRSIQYYARIMVNTILIDNLAFGFVPTYLHNADVRSPETVDIVRFGFHVQYYAGRSLSVLAEWDPQVSGDEIRHDPVSWGLELETGGHFFKLIASNATSLNTSQYAAGSDDPAGGRYWHLGFSITRLLKFW